MPRFLFWNYRCELPDREEILARLVYHEAVDVVLLAESSCEPSRLVDRLSSAGRRYQWVHFTDQRFQVFSGYTSRVFSRILDHDRLLLMLFKVPGHPEIILGVVHLDSGLHLERGERKSKAAELARTIRLFQKERHHSRSIIVGDFNLNPFDDGMISPEGFGAMMTKSLVRKNARSLTDRFSRFYNPIWKRLGSEIPDGAPGTYYWNQKREFNIFWNYVDQVLVGHDLLDGFSDSQFRILTTIPGLDEPRQLIRETKLHWNVEVSDHLPILFDVDLTPETDHA